MEKFGKWRDKFSGVGPFLPREKKEKNYIIVFRWIIGIMKFPLFIIAFLSSFINLTLSNYFPIRFIGRIYNRIHSFITYWFFLILFGHWWISAIPTPLIKKIVDEKKWKKPTHGDLIFTTCTSYLNLFWLQATLSPLFIIPTTNNKCIVKGIHSLILKILFRQNLTEGNEESIEEVIENSKKKKFGPLVILSEGSPTNGEGILRFSTFNCNIKDSFVQLIVFSRQIIGKSPNYVVGNPFIHLIYMLGTFKRSVEVKVALQNDVEQPKGEINSNKIEEYRKTLSKLMDIPLLELSGKDYHNFLIQYYNPITKKEKSE